MTCEEFRKLMELRNVPANCTKAELTSLFIHAADCSLCRDFMDNYKETDADLNTNCVDDLKIVAAAFEDPECGPLLVNAIQQKRI